MNNLRVEKYEKRLVYEDGSPDLRQNQRTNFINRNRDGNRRKQQNCHNPFKRGMLKKTETIFGGKRATKRRRV